MSAQSTTEQSQSPPLVARFAVVRPRAIRPAILLLAALLALALAAALLLAPGAQAGLRFPPPQTLSPEGTQPTVDVDSQDRATVAWSRLDRPNDGIQSVRLGADGILGEVNTLAQATEDFFLGPQVAVDPQGAATVVWERDAYGSDSDCFVPPSVLTCVQAVHVDAQGDPGEVQTLSSFSTPDRTLPPPRVARATGRTSRSIRTGRATVVWFAPGPTGNIHSVRLASDGTPGVIQTLGEGLQPQLAVDSSDRVTVVWRTGGDPLRRVQAVRLGADGIPGRIRTLSKHAAFDPQVAVDPKGRATVIWRRLADKKPNQRVEAVRLGRDGKPGKVMTVSGGAFDPQVVVDHRGRATVVWVRAKHKKGTTVRVQSVRLGAHGTPGAVRTLSKDFAGSPHVAVDSRGRATVVWAWGRRGGSGTERIQARRLPRRGPPEGVRTLSEPALNASDPHVAVDSQGRPTVVWATGGPIQSTRGDSRSSATHRFTVFLLAAVFPLSLALAPRAEAFVYWADMTPATARSGAPTSTARASTRASSPRRRRRPTAGWRSTPRTSTGPTRAFRHDRARQPRRHAASTSSFITVPVASAAGWRSTPRTSTGPTHRSRHDRARQPRRHGRRPELHHRPGPPSPGWRSTPRTSTGPTPVLAGTIGRANLDGTGVDQSFITGAGHDPYGRGGRRRAHLLGQRRAPARSGAPTSTARASTGASSPARATSLRGGGRRRARLLGKPDRCPDGHDRARQPRRHGRRPALHHRRTIGPAGVAVDALRSFSFGKVKRNKKKGTAKLTVKVPGPGEVELAENERVKPKRKQAEAAGKVKLPIKPRRKAKKR